MNPQSYKKTIVLFDEINDIEIEVNFELSHNNKEKTIVLNSVFNESLTAFTYATALCELAKIMASDLNQQFEIDEKTIN